jgi:hypothetical protein
LPASGDGRPTPSNWCDYCSKLVGTKLQDGSAPIQKCAVRAREDAATTLERVFLTKWHAKHQATFRYPGRGKPRQGKFCFVCNVFVDDSELLEACEAENGLDEAEEVADTESVALTIPAYSVGEARYPECELRLYTVYFVTCTICNTKIPLGNIRDGQLKYRWLNNRRCFCGNKKALLTAQESQYYIWDMECFTEGAIWREGSELGKQCGVSEHKAIFIAACNMTNMSRVLRGRLLGQVSYSCTSRQEVREVYLHRPQCRRVRLPIYHAMDRTPRSET